MNLTHEYILHRKSKVTKQELLQGLCLYVAYLFLYVNQLLNKYIKRAHLFRYRCLFANLKVIFFCYFPLVSFYRNNDRGDCF